MRDDATKKNFEQLIRKVRNGTTTVHDADQLRAMMHEAWARNSDRAKNVVKLSDRASFEHKQEPKR